MSENTASSNIPDGVQKSSPSDTFIPDFTIAQLNVLPPFTLRTYRAAVEPIAKKIEQDTGIYYLVPIIQSAHESRNGNSGLARHHGNLFGMTANSAWKQAGRPVAFLPTWEMISGKKVDTSREFRHYPSWLESYQDWAHILTTLSIYKPAYALLKDPGKVRDGIREMAKFYATDEQYSKKLLALFDEAEK